MVKIDWKKYKNENPGYTDTLNALERLYNEAKEIRIKIINDDFDESLVKGFKRLKGIRDEADGPSGNLKNEADAGRFKGGWGFSKIEDIVWGGVDKERFRNEAKEHVDSARAYFKKLIREAANGKLKDEEIHALQGPGHGDNWEDDVCNRISDTDCNEDAYLNMISEAESLIDKIEKELVKRGGDDTSGKIKEIKINDTNGIEGKWQVPDKRKKEAGWTWENILSDTEKEWVIKHIKDGIGALGLEEKEEKKWLGDFEAKEKEIRELDVATGEWKYLPIPAWYKKPNTGEKSTWKWIKDKGGGDTNEELPAGQNLTTVREQIVEIANNFINDINEELNRPSKARASRIVRKISEKLAAGTEVSEAEKKQLEEILTLAQTPAGEEYLNYLADKGSDAADSPKNYLRVADLFFQLDTRPAVPRLRADNLKKYWGFEVELKTSLFGAKKDQITELKDWRKDNNVAESFSHSESEFAVQYLVSFLDTIGDKERVFKEFSLTYEKPDWGLEKNRALFRELVKEQWNSAKDAGESVESIRDKVVSSVNDWLADLVALNEILQAEDCLGGREKKEEEVEKKDSIKLGEKIAIIDKILNDKTLAGGKNIYENLLLLESWLTSENKKEEEEEAEEKLRRRGSSSSRASSRGKSSSTKKRAASSSTWKDKARAMFTSKVDNLVNFRTFLVDFKEQLETQQKLNDIENRVKEADGGVILDVELKTKLKNTDFEIKKSGGAIPFTKDSWNSIIEVVKKYTHRLISDNKDGILTEDEKTALQNEKNDRATAGHAMTAEQEKEFINTNFRQLFIKKEDGNPVFTFDNPQLAQRIKDWMNRADNAELNNFSEKKIKQILTRAYTKQIAVEKLFELIDNQAVLFSRLVALNEVENYVLVGDQKETLNKKKTFGADEFNEKVSQGVFGLIREQQNWNNVIVSEEKLKEKLK